MLEHEAVSATNTIAILIREGAATLLKVTNSPLARHYRQVMGMAFCDVSDSPSLVPETMNKSCGLLDGRTLASRASLLPEFGPGQSWSDPRLGIPSDQECSDMTSTCQI